MHKAAMHRLGVIGVVLIGFGAALMAPAFACTNHPETWSTPSEAQPGAVVTIHGAYYEGAGLPVDIYWGGASSGTLMASATLDRDGGFSQAVTIPSNAQANNTYVIQSLRRDTAGDRSPQTANLTFKVTSAPPADPQPAPAASSSPDATPTPADQTAPVPTASAAKGAASTPTPVATVNHRNRTTVAPAAAPLTVPAPVTSTPVVRVPTLADRNGAVGDAPAPVLSDPARSFGRAPAPEGVIPSDSGTAPWVLVPLAVIALGLFSLGTAVVAHDVRRRQVRAEL